MSSSKQRNRKHHTITEAVSSATAATTPTAPASAKTEQSDTGLRVLARTLIIFFLLPAMLAYVVNLVWK